MLIDEIYSTVCEALGSKIRIEHRMIVRGWKVDGYRVQQGHDTGYLEFSSVHNDPLDSQIAEDRSRIGEEGLPNWQPHITSVTVERRLVTDWEEAVE